MAELPPEHGGSDVVSEATAAGHAVPCGRRWIPAILPETTRAGVWRLDPATLLRLHSVPMGTVARPDFTRGARRSDGALAILEALRGSARVLGLLARLGATGG